MDHKRWTLVENYQNCGKPSCKCGCWDADAGTKTRLRPHGPYLILTRWIDGTGTTESVYVGSKERYGLFIHRFDEFMEDPEITKVPRRKDLGQYVRYKLRMIVRAGMST